MRQLAKNEKRHTIIELIHKRKQDPPPPVHTSGIPPFGKFSANMTKFPANMASVWYCRTSIPEFLQDCTQVVYTPSYTPIHSHRQYITPSTHLPTHTGSIHTLLHTYPLTQVVYNPFYTLTHSHRQYTHPPTHLPTNTGSIHALLHTYPLTKVVYNPFYTLTHSHRQYTHPPTHLPTHIDRIHALLLHTYLLSQVVYTPLLHTYPLAQVVYTVRTYPLTGSIHAFLHTYMLAQVVYAVRTYPLAQVVYTPSYTPTYSLRYSTQYAPTHSPGVYIKF